MAPIRRYLRITKYSVLEVRVYLDNPALAQTWLLNPRDPVLPRIIKAVRPLVLPKLREENERTKGKGKKQKGVKDVVSEGTEDFEVSIFLTELSTRHSLLTKQKNFHAKESKMRSNSGKLTGWLKGTNEKPIEVEGDEIPITIREESDEEAEGVIKDYPDIQEKTGTAKRHGKRPREASNEALFINDDISEDEGFQTQTGPALKRPRATKETVRALEDEDDKKKLGLKTSYDGFSIYGRILCLVVKRRGGNKGRIPGASANEAGQQMLESWVSTQAAQDGVMLDD